MVKDYREANCIRAKSQEPKENSLYPLPNDYFLINVDGAIPTKYGHSGIGIIIWDKDLKFTSAMCKPLSERFGVEETEAIALEKA
nr:hypothetical protein CFP56_47247 [Quercus suber]